MLPGCGRHLLSRSCVPISSVPACNGALSVFVSLCLVKELSHEHLIPPRQGNAGVKASPWARVFSPSLSAPSGRTACRPAAADEALDTAVASACVQMTREPGVCDPQEGRRGRRSSLLRAGCSLVRREHWERLHINCLLQFPSFTTNECL